MNLISRMSRLFVAMTLLTGPTGPVFAESAIAPSLKNKVGTPYSLGRGKKADQGAQARARAASLNLPLYFEANRGQTDASVKFFTRGAGYNLFLTASEAVMVLPTAAAAKRQGAVVVRMKLKGANPNPSVRGRDILPGYSNYLIGNDPSKWQNGVKHYAKVAFGQVYPGIDMVYHGDRGQVEYDFVVAPGANPGRILIGFEGAKGLRLDSHGNLILSVEGGELTYKAPTLYQRLGGRRTHVKGRFALAGHNQARFEVGDYIRSRELVIDPPVAYQSFLGGTGDDRAHAIAVDATGQAYLTGQTSTVGFPGSGSGFQSAITGGAVYNAFVTKISAAASPAIIWSTYLGGTGTVIGNGIGVDGTGKVYVTGSTTVSSTWPGPSTSIGGLGGTDAFVVSLKADGTGPLNYAVLFGGSGIERGNGIAVDAAGNAYVTGSSDSASPDFVTTPGAAQVNNGGGGMSDAFVAKFSAAGTQMYSTFLGGTGVDAGNAIAIDSTGNVYITGQTTANLPVTPTAPPASAAFKLTVTGSSDVIAAKLNPSGSTWLYVTYIGGSGQEAGMGVAVGAPNTVYITGWTDSADFPGSGFVTVGQTTIVGAPDAFVFKLQMGNGGGTNDGVYATYVGGSGEDRATAIAVDAAGDAYITGLTSSGDFPMVGPVAGQGTLVGAQEAFVTEIGPTGATRLFSTYLGGTSSTIGASGPQAGGIALDSTDNIYVTGWTDTTAATFPGTNPFQSANAGGFDAFITKLGTNAGPPPAACTITSIVPNSGFTLGGTVVTITGTDFSGVVGPGGVTFDLINAASYTVNAASTVITAVTPRHPLSGPLAAGSVPVAVSASAGPCSTTYNYTLSPVAGSGSCGDDYFFPSPATGGTGTFAYCMERAGTAKIRVYNVIGDLAAKLEDVKPAGAQSSTLNTGRLAPGVYLYRLEKNYDDGTNFKTGVKKFVVRH